MAFVRHGVLTANTVTEIVLPARKLDRIEVSNRDGAAEIFFRVANVDRNPDPVVGGDDTEILLATLNSVEMAAPDRSPISVKLISAGTPSYTVRAD